MVKEKKALKVKETYASTSSLSKRKFFKKQLMAYTYDSIRDLLQKFESLKFIEKTESPEDVKNGYKPTDSGGSGYVNTKQLNTWLKSKNAS